MKTALKNLIRKAAGTELVRQDVRAVAAQLDEMGKHLRLLSEPPAAATGASATPRGAEVEPDVY